MATVRIVRTTDRTVTFARAFHLAGLAGSQSAGTYHILTEDEEIAGDAFLALRHIATHLHIPVVSPVISIANGCAMVVTINPTDLEAALVADQTA